MLRKYLKNRHFMICIIIVFVLLFIKISCYNIAYAWSIPVDYGEIIINEGAQQTSINEYNMGVYSANDCSYGATAGEVLGINQWHIKDNTTRYAIYFMTIRLDDDTYDAVKRKAYTTITTTTNAQFKCEDQTFDSDIAMNSFAYSGEIINSGLGIDDFIDTSNAIGNEARIKSYNYESLQSSTAELVLTENSGRYIRFGVFCSIQSFGELLSTGQINDITINIDISVEDYFVGNVSYDNLINNQTNVYYRNQGDLYGVDIDSVANNSEYGIMQNSKANGSSIGLLQPEYDTILSQAGEAPDINNIELYAGNYSDGNFGPNIPISFLPDINFNTVSELERPQNVYLDEVLPVGDININKNIPEEMQPDTQYDTPIVTVNTLYAKEPADAYKWKNPLELDPNLSNRVEYTYSTSSGELWTYTKHFYDIMSSGTIDFNLKHKIEGWADEVQIKFHTNDQDMHILLSEGIEMMWGNDKDSKMEIIGTGKVFIYLMGNNHLFFDADYWTTDANFLGTSEREEVTRLFFVGIGGSNTMELLKINARVAIYMPHGRSAENNPGPNRVEFVSNTEMHEINGIVVADELVFGIEEDGKFTFYRNYDSIRNKYLSGLPMIIHFNGYDRNLNYFLHMPLSVTAFPNYNWRSDKSYYD